MSVETFIERQALSTFPFNQVCEPSPSHFTKHQEVAAPKIKNLHFDTRNNCFYLKMKTPERFRHVYSGAMIRRSLSTRDRNLAVQRLTAKRNEVINELESLRSGVKLEQANNTDPIKTEHHLSEAHIPVLIHNFKTEALRVDQKNRQNLGDDEFDAYCEKTEEQLKAVTRALARMNFQEFLPLTRELLKREKLTSPQNRVLERLTESVAIAHGDVLKAIKKRNEGNFTESTHRAVCVEARTLPTLRTAFEQWSEGQANSKTIQAYRNSVAEFENAQGNIPLASITPAVVHTYASTLIEKQLAASTIGNRLGYLNTLLARFIDHLKRTETDQNVLMLKLGQNLLNGKNPFIKTNLPVMKGKSIDERRQPFDIDVALQILDAVQICENKDENLSNQSKEFGMFVKLAFFTGARCEELAQLRAGDLIYSQGHPCLHLHNKDGNNLKTTSSIRKIPLHAELINGGVLDFLHSKLEQGPDTLLFGAIVSNAKDRRKGAAIGKRFERLLKKLGIKNPGLCLHSARYNAKQAMTSSGCNAQATDAYFGHWDKSSAGTYMSEKGGGFNTASLITAIKATVFPYHIN